MPESCSAPNSTESIFPEKQFRVCCMLGPDRDSDNPTTGGAGKLLQGLYSPDRHHYFRFLPTVSRLLKSTNFVSLEPTSNYYAGCVVQSESHASSSNLTMLYRDIEIRKKDSLGMPMSLADPPSNFHYRKGWLVCSTEWFPVQICNGKKGLCTVSL